MRAHNDNAQRDDDLLERIARIERSIARVERLLMRGKARPIVKAGTRLRSKPALELPADTTPEELRCIERKVKRWMK
jgi:hypothetical protein